MDFSQVKLFGKKSFSDLLKEIHVNQKDKEVQLRIVQRAMNSKAVDSEELLTDEDKEMLFTSLQELDQKVEIPQLEEKIEKAV